METTSDHDARARGFNPESQHRLWRDTLLPRLILPLYWMYEIALLPSVLMGRTQRRRNAARGSVVAIESGKIGWTQVFFEEMGTSAEEHFGASSVVRETIDREQPYVPQQRANLDRDEPTHLVLDVRTGGQDWWRSLSETFRVAWGLNRRGIVPIVILTDAFYRRQRWVAAALTASRGVVVTYADARILAPIFPHDRLVGPLIMPVSRARLAWLDSYRASVTKTGRRVQFIGHVYTPRKELLAAVGEELSADGIVIEVNGDKWGTSNEDYWRTLCEADVIVTTTSQGPARSIIDWNWVQQAVFRYIETMAAGAALVASPAPGIDRFFEKGIDYLGFVSVDDAAQAIRSLTEDQDRLKQISTAGHRRASELIENGEFWRVIDGALGADRTS